MAVTIPAAMEDPDKTWGEVAHGLRLRIRHHMKYDGQEFAPGNFWNYWKNHVKEQFKEGYDMCDSHVREKLW